MDGIISQQTQLRYPLSRAQRSACPAGDGDANSGTRLARFAYPARIWLSLSQHPLKKQNRARGPVLPDAAGFDQNAYFTFTAQFWPLMSPPFTRFLVIVPKVSYSARMPQFLLML